MFFPLPALIYRDKLDINISYSFYWNRIQLFLHFVLTIRDIRQPPAEIRT